MLIFINILLLIHIIASYKHNNTNIHNNNNTNIYHSNSDIPFKPITINDFYYIPSTEGVIAHLRELATLSDILSIYNKTIIVLPFISNHYPDISYINICKIFILPNNIICSNISIYEIILNNDCYMLSNHSISYHIINNPLIKQHLHISNKFSYSNINCYIGGLNYSIGSYDQSKLIKHPMGIRTFRIKSNYIGYINYIKHKMHFNNKNHYIVVHWRRGDQLTTRCNPLKERKYLDTTVNCQDIDSFLTTLNNNLNKYIYINKGNLKLPIYIATNEEDTTILNQLKSYDYILYSDIKPYVKESNSLIDFIIELMLMCDSKYYMSWGDSSIHRYVAGYRLYINKFNNNSYIYNDQLGFDIYS